MRKADDPAGGDWAAAFARRTLQSWAVFNAAHALVLALLVVLVVPWREPAISLALLGYAGGHALSSVGLWKGRRWGWRLAAGLGFLGLAACVALVALLVASWAYLRTVWGSFGFGASIASLLIAGVVVQFLGLHPTLLLRALFRREVRHALGAGSFPRRALLVLLVAPPLLGFGAGGMFRLDGEPPLSPEARTAATVYLRARLEGRDPTGLEAVGEIPGGEAPLRVALWRAGAPALEVRGSGATLAEQLRTAGDLLEEGARTDPGLRRAALRVDRVVGSGRLPLENGAVVALSVDPAVQGFMRGDRLLLPDEMLRAGLLAAAPLIPGIHELRFGLDAEGVLERLDGDAAPLKRVRVESWLEFQGAALPLERANTPLPHTGPDAWRHAAGLGGRYILDSVRPDGLFQMEYLPLQDVRPAPGPEYSVPRHAGTAYALVLLFHATGDARYREAAEAALAWVATRLTECGIGTARCVAVDGQATLGASALAAVAMLEYERRTGSGTWRTEAADLLAFIASLQQADGDFVHFWDVQARRPASLRRVEFYSEEAAFALAMGYNVLGDARILHAAERALDHLTGAKYEPFFLGRYLFGTDHWTCIAAEEAWPALPKEAYLDFCLEYMGFMRRLQFRRGASPPGYAGHYGFSFFVVPHAPNTAALTEAALATYALALHHKRQDDGLRTQIADALDALARDQIRPENAYLMPNPGRAMGGVRLSLVETTVRVDNVQHAVTAWILGSRLLEG